MIRLIALLSLLLVTACAAPRSVPPPQTEHAAPPATPTAAPTPQPTTKAAAPPATPTATPTPQPTTKAAAPPATPAATPTSQPTTKAAPPQVVVGVSGTHFTLNGEPTFLLGVSYFDARAWRLSDLDALDRKSVV